MSLLIAALSLLKQTECDPEYEMWPETENRGSESRNALYVSLFNLSSVARRKVHYIFSLQHK